MLHHKFFTRGEDITSFTIVSTGRRVTLSLFVCFLNNISDTSAMLTIHECGDQSPPLDNDEIFNHCPQFPLALSTSRLGFLCYVRNYILGSFCSSGI